MSAVLLDLLAQVGDHLALAAPGLLDAADAVDGTIRAEGDDEGGALWLLASGPVAGFALYAAIYRYYRNHDKSHSFERETLIHPQPVQGEEQKVDHIRRTRDKRIKEENGRDYRKRVLRVQPPPRSGGAQHHNG